MQSLSYLFAAGYRGGGFHLLRDDALLLPVEVVRRCGRECFLFELLRFGVLAEVLVRGRRARCDRRGGHVRTAGGSIVQLGRCVGLFVCVCLQERFCFGRIWGGGANNTNAQKQITQIFVNKIAKKIGECARLLADCGGLFSQYVNVCGSVQFYGGMICPWFEIIFKCLLLLFFFIVSSYFYSICSNLFKHISFRTNRF